MFFWPSVPPMPSRYPHLSDSPTNSHSTCPLTTLTLHTHQPSSLKPNCPPTSLKWHIHKPTALSCLPTSLTFILTKQLFSYPICPPNPFTCHTQETTAHSLKMPSDYSCARSSGPGSQCHPNECIFRSGNPRGSGFWVRGIGGLLREQRGSVYEQQGAEVDGS